MDTIETPAVETATERKPGYLLDIHARVHVENTAKDVMFEAGRAVGHIDRDGCIRKNAFGDLRETIAHLSAVLDAIDMAQSMGWTKLSHEDWLELVKTRRPS